MSAYHLQAQVAAELGLDESSWSHGQARGGAALPLDEVRASIASDELYRMDPTRRLLLGGGLAVAASSVFALGSHVLATRLAPGSYLGTRMWPAAALAGAVTGAWVLADQVRAHRLERIFHPDPAPRI